jgi:hypothetical protein
VVQETVAGDDRDQECGRQRRAGRSRCILRPGFVQVTTKGTAQSQLHLPNDSLRVHATLFHEMVLGDYEPSAMKIVSAQLTLPVAVADVQQRPPRVPLLSRAMLVQVLGGPARTPTNPEAAAPDEPSRRRGLPSVSRPAP